MVREEVGPIRASRATPAGKKRINPALIDASLGSLKKFCKTSDMPKLLMASSHNAIKI